MLDRSMVLFDADVEILDLPEQSFGSHFVHVMKVDPRSMVRHRNAVESASLSTLQ